MQYLTSLQHPLIKHLVRLRDKKAYRHEQKRVLIEGHTTVGEVCRDVPVATLLVTNEAFIPLGIQADEIVVVTFAMMEKISGVNAPEGIVAELKMPEMNLSKLASLRRVIACDGVSDPGNLGTILRTALALGWEGIFLTNSCCDPFNDKALRAAKGATFRIPMAMGSWNQLESMIEKQHWKPLVADINGEPPEKYCQEENVLLVLGSESHGSSAEVKRRCHPVSIPMPGPMESLNVSMAGAILMYVLGKKS